MDVPTTRSGRVRFLVAELVIVVVGVIIALGLESWWSGRQDDARGDQHLLALRSEFTTNLDSLRNNIRRIESIKGAATDLLEVIAGAAERPPVDSLVSLTWEAFSFPPYEPLTTSYNNLIGTGDIRLLDDEELKHDLALFMSEVEHYRRGEGQMQQWHLVVQQFVAREMQGLDWLPTDYRTRWELPAPARRTDWDRLLANPEFEGVLANRVIGTTDNLNNLARVLRPAERIVERLNGVSGRGTS